MQKEFWHQRWAENDIGWHEHHGNALLTAHYSILDLKPQSRVFVPLCGKSMDIQWLMQQGCRVVAIELNQKAIETLFEDLGLEPEISQHGLLKCYRPKQANKNNLEVFVGDFFDLNYSTLGPVNAVYDRASMVALPLGIRHKYTRHLEQISQGAQQLLVVFEYNQCEMDGPPFSISAEDVQQYYKRSHTLKLLQSFDVSGQLRGEFEAHENIYLLSPSINPLIT